MRQSKFRVWDEENKKMIYGIGLTPEGLPFNETEYFSTGITGYPIVKGKKTQWTGLYDKNKKPIYEGDIVTNKTPATTFISITGIVKFGEVEIDNSCGQYNPDWATCWYVETIDFEKIILIENNNVEVVGNIFENPELLKKQKEV